MKVENPRLKESGAVICEDCPFDIADTDECAVPTMAAFSDGRLCPTLTTYQEACALAEAAEKEGR